MKDCPLVFVSFVARDDATGSAERSRDAHQLLADSGAAAAELVMNTALRTIIAWQDW